MAYVSSICNYCANRAAALSFLWSALVSMGWTLQDNQDGSSYRVYKSNGELSDRIYENIKIDWITANLITFTGYLYWDAIIHTGTCPTAGPPSVTTSESSMYIWIYGNKDLVGVVTRVAQTYYTKFFGHIPKKMWSVQTNIIGNVVGGVTAGNTVNVSSISGLINGAYYQLIGANGEGRWRTQVTAISASPVNAYGDNIIPVMSSNSLPYPYVASASAAGGGPAWSAFDRTTTSYWGTGTQTGWLQIDLGAANAAAVTQYAITPYTGSTEAPTNWTFLGSNTGNFAGEQTTLDTQVGINWALSGNFETKVFSFSNTTAFRYYRLNVTSCMSATGLYISLLRLYTSMSNAGSGGSITLSSAVLPSGLGGVNDISCVTNTNFTTDGYAVLGQTPSNFFAGIYTTCGVASNALTASSTPILYYNQFFASSFADPDIRNCNCYILQPITCTESADTVVGYIDQYFLYAPSISMISEDLFTSYQRDPANYSSTNISTGSNTSITLNDTSKNWTSSQWQNKTIVITAGKGIGQTRIIGNNTATQITLNTAWTTIPDTTSNYVICDEVYRYFDLVPNWALLEVI